MATGSTTEILRELLEPGDVVLVGLGLGLGLGAGLGCCCLRPLGAGPVGALARVVAVLAAPVALDVSFLVWRRVGVVLALCGLCGWRCGVFLFS